MIAQIAPTIETQSSTMVEAPAADASRDHWKSVARAWMEEVRQRGGSLRTPVEYGRYLNRFMHQVDDPKTVTPAQVYSFGYSPGPSGKEPSPGTVTMRLAAIRSFYDFARRMGIVDNNPAHSDYVRRPKQRPVTPRGLNADQLRRLLDTVPSTAAGVRDKAAIITFVFTGLRRSELLGLRRRNLSTDGEVFYTIRVKGGQERRRELPAPAFNAIIASLEAQGRPMESLDPDDRIFDVSPQGFYSNLRRYARRAGLGPLSIHALRHSAAKLRRSTGSSLEDVSTFLGHQNISTTHRYLTRLEGEHDSGWHGTAAALGLA